VAKVVSDLHASSAVPPARPRGDLVEFGRDTIGAAVRGNAALGAELEAFGQELARYGGTTFTTMGETVRALLGARTFEDVVRLQSDFANRSFEDFIARSIKLAPLGCSLFGASVGARGARAKI
jgi:hypothetical protein